MLVIIKINANAQFKVFGKTIGNNHHPLQYVSIKLTGVGNKAIYTQSDSSGNYSFRNLSAGKYNIIFSAINFLTQQSNLHILKDTLINIQLKENANILADIQIDSKKKLIERKIDRTVFNVAPKKPPLY